MKLSEAHRFELDTHTSPLSHELILQQLRIHIHECSFGRRLPIQYKYTFLKKSPGIRFVCIPIWMAPESQERKRQPKEKVKNWAGCPEDIQVDIWADVRGQKGSPHRTQLRKKSSFCRWPKGEDVHDPRGLVYFFVTEILIPRFCRADMGWVYILGLANTTIAHKFLSKLFGLFSPGFQAPPSPKIQPLNSRPKLLAFLSQTSLSRRFSQRIQPCRKHANVVNYYAVAFLLRPPYWLLCVPFFGEGNACKTKEDGIRTGVVAKAND